jgi:hypothetical protein
MATAPVLQGVGTIPFGNAGGSQVPGPSSILQGQSGPNGISSNISANPAQNPPLLPPGITGNISATPSPIPVTATPTGAAAINSGTNTSELNTNLNNDFGKGVGSLISSELGNIGSNNDAYMQAYEAAMQQPNAENLSTLQTTLGNEGVSGNSSTSAIATADFESGVTSQEGLQEQQLQENDVSQVLGLTESLEGPAAQSQQNTGWSEFGQVLGSIGGAVGSALLI